MWAADRGAADASAPRRRFGRAHGPAAGRALASSLLVLALWTSGAAAQASCFRIDGKARSDRSSQRVTLSSTLTIDPRCEYALAPEGPFRALEGEAVSGFASLVTALAAPPKAADEQAKDRAPLIRAVNVFARRPATRARPAGPLSSVFLASCSAYLLSGEQGFAVSVPVETQQPRIARAPAGHCGAEGLTLRFARLPRAGAEPDLLAAGPFSSELPVGTESATLPAGRWAVYGARAEESGGVLLGVLDTGSSLSPLRLAVEALSRDGSEPWLRATWQSGSLELEPTSEELRESDAWAELRSAATSNAAWLVQRHSEGEQVLGPLSMVNDGAAIRLPPGPLAEQMELRYGDHGQHMTPTFEDWNGTYDGLSLCVAPRYPEPGPGIGAPPPAGAPCVPMAKLVAPLAVRGGAALASGQVCLRRRAQVMTVKGPRPATELGEQCFSLPGGGANEPTPAVPIALTGDQLTFSGAGAEHLFVCDAADCQPAPRAGEWMPLMRPGLVEIRHAERAQGLGTREGLALMRIGVIDPATEWHPTGLYDADATAAPPRDRWTTLAHDEDDVFVYQRGYHQLAFGLTPSPRLAAAYDHTHDARLGPHVPVVVRSESAFTSPPGSALEVVVTQRPACPTRSAAAVRREAINPDSLLVDQRFYAHLAHYRGESQPFDCVAVAGFRVTERMTRRAAGKVRVGLFGDAQLLAFVNRPAAVGVAMPLVHARWRWVQGLGLDASGSVLTALTFDEAAVSRAGVGVSASAYWGPESFAPRLLSFGVMLHATTGNSRRSEPGVSVIAGLNLSTLWDLAGGR